MIDDLKRALGSVFTRDVRSVEPKRKGLIVGDNLRIYEEKNAFVLSFLRGTDERVRRSYRDKLTNAGLSFSTGEDYAV